MTPADSLSQITIFQLTVIRVLCNQKCVFKAPKMKTADCCVYRNEVAHGELSHPDLHCLPASLLILNMNF